MKISKKLRAEAVESCLCSAQFHMDPLQHAGVGVFSGPAINVAWRAVDEVCRRRLQFRDHSVEGRAAEWEDAAKLLMAGWTP